MASSGAQGRTLYETAAPSGQASGAARFTHPLCAARFDHAPGAACFDHAPGAARFDHAPGAARFDHAPGAARSGGRRSRESLARRDRA
ncbi:hypothetical protein [Sorangium sp. So ce385]|uniref:hypothetical protein n=1 Tax=Sorangium sp. So ce385 TaxID=3133308 RepID=UPI003F5BCDEB